MVLYNSSKANDISNCVLMSYTMFSRMKGLLGRKQLAVNCCMHLKPCNSIHTFFMQFPIDVVFLDRRMRVVYLMEEVERGKMSPIIMKAHSVIELPAGKIKLTGIQLDDMLELK